MWKHNRSEWNEENELTLTISLKSTFRRYISDRKENPPFDQVQWRSIFNKLDKGKSAETAKRLSIESKNQ